MTNEDIEKRMLELVGFLLIRANRNRGEAKHYKERQRADLASYFDGLCRGYLDSINEIACRLSPQMEPYFDAEENEYRLRARQDLPVAVDSAST